MSASVGARLESVAPKRTLFGPDYLRLAALAAVALAVHVWLMSHTALTARDSLGFARQALCYETPSAVPVAPNERAKTAIDLVRESEHPPGYPLVIWGTFKAVSLVSTAPVADRALFSAQLANALAAVLLVVPTYLIGRLLFSRNVGFAAALLFQVLPVPARITSDGLTEGVYLLATATALFFAVRAVVTPRISSFLLCGLAVGASYLVRPEGLMLLTGPAAVVFWLGLIRRWPRDLALARLAALFVGVCLVAVPYMALIGKLTNKPSPGQMLNPLAAPQPVYRGANAVPAAPSGPLFAEWWNDARDSGQSQNVWAVNAVFKEVSKGANYVVWPLAAFAVLALRRKLVAEPGPWVLLVLAACNLTVLLYLAARVGYVSERHTVLLTLIACQLAAAGLPLLAVSIGQVFPRVERFGVRVTAATLLAALVAGALPFALKPMHPNREGHKHAGRWLAANLKSDEALIDPFCWAAWYSGRALYRPSGYNPEFSSATYIVKENNARTPHSRLPVLAEANQLAAQPNGAVAYHWPENVPEDEAVIHIVRIRSVGQLVYGTASAVASGARGAD
ncbi:glycosyltransferase family 39 protein [Gemmata sp. JC673]|uniref:Glycosyltransferase family 39 protein n=1 Tax=Gemmata algarum TaxID=2975278 RepID=A0ABU5EX71_9BACT|nr:glycosyltransferase family 39 protein [Gemmata algarum]MDY3559897.1 glycosyltransferase family 39 protein [Gemmata algarum]